MNDVLDRKADAPSGSLAEQLTAAKRRGDAADARRILLAARALQPRSAEDEMTLGFVNLELGDFTTALGWFIHAAELKPGLAAAHTNQAIARQLLKQPLEALTAATRALGLNPRDLTALKLIARNSFTLGRIKEARAACEQILGIDPLDPDGKALLNECRSAAPEGLFGSFATRTRTWQQLGSEHLLQQLVVGIEPNRVVVRPTPTSEKKAVDGFAMPPAGLTMGYAAGDLDRYLALGRSSYRVLQTLLADQGITLQTGDAVLDWGCAAGRVVRCFAEEARRGCAIWGGDVDVPCIEWAKGHLSPPFRFFNCSSLPHLPFADRTFKVIYGFSVMTHIVALRDLWLLEINRVLQSGGCAILSIHDENTWESYYRRGMPEWMPAELRGQSALPGECVDLQGSTWNQTYTFFHSDYIRRVWGQYFRMAAIIPLGTLDPGDLQTAVVLRKD